MNAFTSWPRNLLLRNYSEDIPVGIQKLCIEVMISTKKLLEDV